MRAPPYVPQSMMYPEFCGQKRGYPLKGTIQGKIVPRGNEIAVSLPTCGSFEY